MKSSNRDESESSDSIATRREAKRVSKLPSYVTTFFSLNNFPALPPKQANELVILEKFLKHEIISPDFVRFGDDGAFEPDFVVKQADKVIGIEITEIYGSREIAIAYKTPYRKQATEQEWLEAIKERYEDKLSERKDGKRYDRSKFDQIILLMDDRSGRDSAIKFSNPLKLLPNGTPVTNVTLFQQLFQPWSNVIDESYLLGSSSTNDLETILIKGHLNIHFSTQALESSLESSATIPFLIQEEDAKENFKRSKVIDTILTTFGEITVVWRDETFIDENIEDTVIDTKNFQKDNNVSICEVSFILKDRRIGCILAESDGESYKFKNPTYFGYFIHQVILEKEFRHVGLGSALYIYVARMIAKTFGSQLRSGTIPTDRANRVWSSLAKRGLNISTHEEQFSSLSAPSGKLTIKQLNIDSNLK